MKAGLAMNQPRRVAPRVPYDEAIAIARFDGRGRLYARAIDLSATGIHVICAESCPLGTVVRCTLLLPGGPRTVRGRVVRETVLARGCRPGDRVLERRPRHGRRHRTPDRVPRAAGDAREAARRRRRSHVALRRPRRRRDRAADGDAAVPAHRRRRRRRAGRTRRGRRARRDQEDRGRSVDLRRRAPARASTSRWPTTRSRTARSRARATRTRRRRPRGCRRPAAIRCRRCWCRPGWRATCARPRSGRRGGACTAPPRFRAARGRDWSAWSAPPVVVSRPRARRARPRAAQRLHRARRRAGRWRARRSCARTRRGPAAGPTCW